VEKELLTFPEHLSSPPFFSEVHVIQAVVLGVVFCKSLLGLLYFFFLSIVLSVILQFKAFDHPFALCLAASNQLSRLTNSCSRGAHCAASFLACGRMVIFSI
jgi:hypothetical protein